MASRRNSHKEQRITKTVMIIISLMLCFLIFDNWLGMTLAQNDALPSYIFDFTDADEVCYRAGEGIVLYPHEAHLPGRAVQNEMAIKKAVVKLAVSCVRYGEDGRAEVDWNE